MSKAYLFDTNILSSLLKPGPRREKILDWILENPGDYAASVVVIYEIESGLRLRGLQRLLDSFTNDLLPNLDTKAFDVNVEIARLAGIHRAEGLKRGETYHAEDLFIGATALYHKHILVTHNVKDFKKWIPLLINPLAQS